MDPNDLLQDNDTAHCYGLAELFRNSRYILPSCIMSMYFSPVVNPHGVTYAFSIQNCDEKKFLEDVYHIFTNDG